jgi:hypothetical protein
MLVNSYELACSVPSALLCVTTPAKSPDEVITKTWLARDYWDSVLAGTALLPLKNHAILQ